MTKPLVRLGAVLASGLAALALAGVAAAPASAHVQPNDGLDHLVLTPSTSSITAGSSASYTAEGFDAENDDLGDVTADTTFSITPDGSCTGTACTATVAGPHTVTGTDGAATGTASLTVTGAALSQLVVTATPFAVKKGATDTITVEAFDQYGNDLGDKTHIATITVSTGASCVQNECFSNTAGVYTVTAKEGSVTGTTTFGVNALKNAIKITTIHKTLLSAGSVVASATATSGLPVTFTSATPAVCTTGGANGATITLLTIGTCTILGNQAGSTAYYPAKTAKKSFKVA